LNFDGASKGNLGRVGVGGAICNRKGKIIRLYATSVGNTTNNAAEFFSREQGLEILVREGIVNVTMEGHSALVIGTVRRIQCGTKIGKIITHWRLTQILQRIQRHLLTLFSIDFRWVRRTANALADRLANEGVNQEGNLLDMAWTQVPVGQLKTDCEHLVEQDRHGSNREDIHIVGNE
jgi:ribonuclease HI